MKKLSIYLLTLAAAVFASCEKPYDYSRWYEDSEENGGQEIVTEVKEFDLSVMCFNVKNSNDDKGTVNSWDNRRAGVYAMIKDKKPHVAGLQECFHSQKNDILNNCPAYKAYAIARDSGSATSGGGETCAIIYNADSLTLINSGTFWLSATPEKVSTGWGASIRRIASWAIFEKNATGQRFFFMNTHLDHQVEAAKVNGIELIKQKIAELNVDNLPVALTGDFNSEPTQAWMVSLNEMLGDCRKDAPLSDNYSTSHGYGKKNQLIDHIYYKDFTPLSFETIRSKWSGVTYISDHYPVMAKFNFGKKSDNNSEGE